MKRIKSVLLLFVVFVLLFSISACRGKEEGEQSDKDNKINISTESDDKQEHESDFTQEETLKNNESSSNDANSTVTSERFDDMFGEQKDDPPQTDNNTTGATAGEPSDETGNQQTGNEEGSEKEDFGVSEDVDGAKYGRLHD